MKETKELNDDTSFDKLQLAPYKVMVGLESIESVTGLKIKHIGIILDIGLGCIEYLPSNIDTRIVFDINKAFFVSDDLAIIDCHDILAWKKKNEDGEEARCEEEDIRIWKEESRLRHNSYPTNVGETNTQEEMALMRGDGRAFRTKWKATHIQGAEYLIEIHGAPDGNVFNLNFRGHVDEARFQEQVNETTAHADAEINAISAAMKAAKTKLEAFFSAPTNGDGDGTG